MSVTVTVRRVAQMLVVPHGFTLCVAGTLSICVGERGYPGVLAIWLFVTGAGLAFAVTLFATAGHRDPPTPESATMGAAVFNITPAAVVPAVWAATHWIDDDRLALLTAGVLTVALYLGALAVIIIVAARLTTASGSCDS